MKFMLISVLKLGYCMVQFPCVIMLLIFFYWFYYIFNVLLFLFLINLCASFLLWWYSCSSNSLLHFITQFSLAFFISSIAIVHFSPYHLLFNVSVLSSFSMSCCFVSFIIVLMLPHFSLILFSTLSSLSIFSSCASNNACSKMYLNHLKCGLMVKIKHLMWKLHSTIL